MSWVSVVVSNWAQLPRVGNRSVRNFTGGAELLSQRGDAPAFPCWDFMLTLLEAIAFVILVAVSFAGFAVAVMWTCAIWFGNKS